MGLVNCMDKFLIERRSSMKPPVVFVLGIKQKIELMKYMGSLCEPMFYKQVPIVYLSKVYDFVEMV